MKYQYKGHSGRWVNIKPGKMLDYYRNNGVLIREKPVIYKMESGETLTLSQSSKIKEAIGLLKNNGIRPPICAISEAIKILEGLK